MRDKSVEVFRRDGGRRSWRAAAAAVVMVAGSVALGVTQLAAAGQGQEEGDLQQVRVTMSTEYRAVKLCGWNQHSEHACGWAEKKDGDVWEMPGWWFKGELEIKGMTADDRQVRKGFCVEKKAGGGWAEFDFSKPAPCAPESSR